MRGWGRDTMWLRDALIRATAQTAIVLPTMSSAYSHEDLREAAQNPIADLISVPFQNNTNFGLGDMDHIQNVLNIQPVFPTHLNAD